MHRRARRDEQGIVAVVTALVLCFVLVPIASFAVDFGVQRVATRDMQALADVVALDLGRELDGRTYSQLQPHLQTWADASAARNDGIGTGRVVRAELGKVDESAYTPANPGAIFTPVTSDAGGIPTAVRITASTSVHFAIHGGSGSATRTSIARADSTACFRMGSWAARLDSASSPLLNSLIGDALNLSAVSYQGLATSSITLGALAAQLSAGTPDQLLALDNVSLGDLFRAAANVLQANGGNAANVTLLNSLATAGFAGVTNTHVAMGDLFDIASGAGSAFATSVNLYDLVAATAFLANGSSFLAIPSFSAGLPWLAPNLVAGNLKVIQKPILTCGPVGTQAESSQIDLDATVTLPSASIPLLVSTASTVRIQAQVAPATGTLTGIQCTTGLPVGIDVAVTTALARISTAMHVDIKALAGLATVATVDTGSGGTVSGSSSTVSIRVPSDSYDTPKSTGTTPTETTIANIASGNVVVLNPPGLPLGATVAGLVSLVNTSLISAYANPLIANANTYLVTPLTKALGLRLGGADVYLPSAPSCGDVALVG